MRRKYLEALRGCKKESDIIEHLLEKDEYINSKENIKQLNKIEKSLKDIWAMMQNLQGIND